MKNGWHVQAKGTIYEYHRHYVDGKLHREDGPAVLYKDGDVVYYREGKLHREDGPAVVYKDGTVRYYLNDKRLSEAAYWAKQGGQLGRILYGGQE